jgi:hypothetical protein
MATAISYEIGIHNAALAMYIGMKVLNNPGLALALGHLFGQHAHCRGNLSVFWCSVDEVKRKAMAAEAITRSSYYTRGLSNYTPHTTGFLFFLRPFNQLEQAAWRADKG